MPHRTPPHGRGPRLCYDCVSFCRVEDSPVFSTVFHCRPPEVWNVGREPRRERAPSRGGTDSRRMSAQRRRVSAIARTSQGGFIHVSGKAEILPVAAAAIITPNAGPVRAVCPTTTNCQHFKYIPRQSLDGAITTYLSIFYFLTLKLHLTLTLNYYFNFIILTP